MPNKRGLDSQVDRLDEAVQKHSNLDTYPLWVRLVGVLSSMGSEIGSVVIALRGDGNGTKGLLDRNTAMEEAIRSIQSDIREIRNWIGIMAGLEHDPEVLEHIQRFTAHDHPGRRAEDKKTSFDKLLGYVIERILPPLIVAAIVGVVTFWVAVNNHLISGG